MSVANSLVPFEGLSGINAPETDFDGGLGQQLWGLVAATLPTSSNCEAEPGHRHQWHRLIDAILQRLRQCFRY